MQSYAGLKKKLESIRLLAEPKIAEGDHHQVDRHHVVEYAYLEEPKWQKKIENYFQTLKSQHIPIVHVDICGRANAFSLGSDISYLFSLRASPFRKAWASSNEEFIDGDIFSSEDYSQLIRTMKENNHKPALVTFEPVRGLAEYDLLNPAKETPITKYVLEHRLKRMIDYMLPGGLIYLSKPFQSDGIIDFFNNIPQNKTELAKQVKRIARQKKCRVTIGKSIEGPHFLLQKQGYVNTNTKPL